MSVNSGHPMFENFREETFPVIRPLSELPNRVTLDELSASLTGKKGMCKLAPPDTAVVAEISEFYLADMKSSSIACVLKTSSSPSFLLCIRNAAVIKSDSQIPHCAMLYPNSQIAIKSGLFRIIKTGRNTANPTIYVACPAAIEFLGLGRREDEDAKQWKSFDIMSAVGDAASRASQFVHASIWYTAALEANEKEAWSLDSLTVAQAHFDQAHCMLKLQRFEEAILSYDAALEARPGFIEGLYYRALALDSVRNHMAVVADLLTARDIVLASGCDLPEARRAKSSLDHAIPKFMKLANEQRNGEHDVFDFFAGGCDHKGAPDWGDYTSGAIEIRMTGDGRGRGLFLNSDVRAGDLLMVSNPLMMEDSLEELQVLAIGSCNSLPRSWIRRVLKLLQDPKASLKDLPVPSVQDFSFDPIGRTYSWQEEDGAVIDVQRIKRVVEQASRLSFKLTSSSPTSRQLFSLPTLINHSCLPNSSVVVVGGALFIRAATPIKAGEEITISYIDCLQPLATRSKMIENAWDFTCACKRCEVESRYKKQLQGVPEQPTASLEALVKRVDKLENALAKMKAISEEERGMIRVGHIQAYVQVASNKHEKLCHDAGSKHKLLSHIDAIKLLRKFVPGLGKGIALVARMVREYILRLEWDESFELEFDEAMKSMIGDINVPSEHYITLCDHLCSDENVLELFGGS